MDTNHEHDKTEQDATPDVATDVATVRHTLKTWPGPFSAIFSGRKKHEIRVNDRNFAPGDELVLMEWDPGTGEYTGRTIWVRVTYMTRPGEWGLPDHLCVMSIYPIALDPGLTSTPATEGGE